MSLSLGFFLFGIIYGRLRAEGGGISGGLYPKNWRVATVSTAVHSCYSGRCHSAFPQEILKYSAYAGILAGRGHLLDRPRAIRADLHTIRNYSAQMQTFKENGSVKLARWSGESLATRYWMTE
ncbi:hypothetical protein C8Q69DRAFT_229238 [Paecilomyces variotii]|uniref:Uncharacterized protein n=1 Tax=Byssochlamys spectabilis TaxID=264951 RepID=A0A443HW33_BYSSP|nr:hypothetical protein C8Q69DRAFT_229238 [Paecilomyces variotii]RWQ96049.1 hypothetical protein C8Q69DRAFT_229238 [Paecilomyces variotii]